MIHNHHTTPRCFLYVRKKEGQLVRGAGTIQVFREN